jgi:Phosphodiester glycosidase
MLFPKVLLRCLLKPGPTWVLACAALLASCTQGPLQHAGGGETASLPWQTVQRGLRYALVSPWPNSRVHLVQLDLREPSLRLQVSSPQSRGLTMDRLAADSTVVASINASFFSRQHVPRGLTVSDGLSWDGVFLPETSPALACDRMQLCAIHFTPPASPPVAWFNVVSGTPWLVRDGQVRSAIDDNSCESLCARTHPRTAMGLDATGRTLTLVLVEGRQGDIVGVSLSPLAQWMQGLGLHNAINLDGGGSSTLWLQGKAVMGRPHNEPTERALSAALHIVRVGAGAAAGGTD